MLIIRLRLITLCSMLIFSISMLSAQQFTKTNAEQYFQKELQEYGLDASDISELEITDNYVNKRTGLTHIYLRQQFNGIPVREGRGAVHFRPDGSVFGANSKFIPQLADKIEGNTSSLTQKQAIEVAAQHLNLPITKELKQIRTGKNSSLKKIFSHAGLSRREIPVEPMYEFNEAGKLRLVWETQIYQADGQDWWIMRIDATTGKEVSRDNIILHCQFGGTEVDHSDHDHSYLAKLPHKLSPFAQMEQGEKMTEEAPTAPETTESSSMLFGNYNHYALPLESPLHFEFINPGSSDDGRTNLDIDQIVDTDASPFGWHDTDGDASTVEFTWTQGNNTLAFWDPDNTLVNAGVPNIMPTPFIIQGGIINSGNVPDGGPTLDFNIDNEINQVNFNGFVPDAVVNLFVWNNIIHDVSYLYGFNEPSGNFQFNNHGNGGIGNDHVLAGAQSLGFVNNASFGTPAEDDDSASNSPTMSMYLWNSDLPDRTVDGDFDSGVVAHEYGHGISTRMVGGPADNCLGGNEQGGEGWSDYYGLMVTQIDVNGNGEYEEHLPGEGLRGIGNYVTNGQFDDGGIRPTAYSTDMNVNPFTYGDVSTGNLSVPHGVGYGWCTILWDFTWALIGEYGFEFDIYAKESTAGNIRAIATVTEAFRHTPCNPSFPEMRDAIFDAYEALYPNDFANDEFMIWDVFARRGLGFSAIEGGIEAFDTPSFFPTKGVSHVSQDAGGMLEYSISVQNLSGSPLTNVVITDPIDSRLSLVSSNDGATEAGGVVTFSPFTIPTDQTVTKKFTAQIDPAADVSASLLKNEIEDLTEQSSFATLGAWSLDGTNTKSGNNAYFHPNIDQAQVGDLVFTGTIPAGANAFSFWQYLDTEGEFDGGVVEISDDGGTNYEDLGSRMIAGGYNSIINNNFSGVPFTVLDGREAFSGFAPFFQTVVDLTGYSGTVMIRWRFAADTNTGGTGWWIDDVEFSDLYFIKNEASVTVAEFPETRTADIGEIGTVISSDVVLPIELINLTATAKTTNIRLDWATAIEKDNAGFEIMRRAENETTFTKIAYVKGQGTTNKTTEYDFIDNDVKANVPYFYQLNIIDNSGKAALSNIVTAVIRKNQTVVQVFPNPAKAQVSLNIYGANLGNTLEVNVMDVTGQLVRTVQFNNTDKNNFSLDFSDLPEQLYLLRITSGQFTDTQQVLIQR